MKVFISSMIGGFEPLRNAAKTAVMTLRHEPVMAEDFGASPNSPQIACLQGLRRSDLMVLILGERYGSIQPASGLSATHEEYREARGKIPVIAFLQEGVNFSAEQEAFKSEIQGWETGLFRGSFKDPAELQAGVTRALHDYELAKAVGPLDPDEMTKRAAALVLIEDDGSYSSATINLGVVGGPMQPVLRPAQIEAPSLADYLFQAAMLGDHRFFERSKGVDTAVEDSALRLRQERGGLVRLDEQGSLLLRVPLDGQSTRSRAHGGLAVILEEAVHQQIGVALGYASSILDHIDSTQRLTHLAIAARITGGHYLAWRTQSEQMASPNSVSMGFGFGEERTAVHLVRPRAALRLDRIRLIEDLLVPLRRQWK